MLVDPASVFLWMAALMVHGRVLDDEVELGELVWSYLRRDVARAMVMAAA
jgi:hypothetical protein